MAIPTSKTAICNLTLDLLNEKEVTDISSLGASSAPTERLCARWYDTIRRGLLESGNWVFAQSSESVSREGTPSVDRYADKYSFPNNYLRLTAIKDWDYPP